MLFDFKKLKILTCLSVQNMELGATPNHLRANQLQPTNPESSKRATKPDESTEFESLVDHHVAPDCNSRIGSGPAARCRRRRSFCGGRCRHKSSHTKWLTASMSLCNLYGWVLSLCFLLSTMLPHVLAGSAAKGTDSPTRSAYGGIHTEKATRRPRRGE